MNHTVAGPDLSGYSTEDLERFILKAEATGETESLRNELERRYGAHYSHLVESDVQPTTHGGGGAGNGGGLNFDSREIQRTPPPLPKPQPPMQSPPPLPRPQPVIATPVSFPVTVPAPSVKASETNWGCILMGLIALLVLYILI